MMLWPFAANKRCKYKQSFAVLALRASGVGISEMSCQYRKYQVRLSYRQQQRFSDGEG